MEKLYSTIFIVDISQNPDEVDTVSSRVQQLIEDHGGVIKKIDRWGKRRLAYPIKKKTHGYYVEIEFSANSHLNIPKTLEEEYRMNDRVLRYLTYVIDKKELKQRERNAQRMKRKASQQEAKAAPVEAKPPVEEKQPAVEEQKPAEAPVEAKPPVEEAPVQTAAPETEPTAEAPEASAAPQPESGEETVEKKEE